MGDADDRLRAEVNYGVRLVQRHRPLERGQVLERAVDDGAALDVAAANELRLGSWSRTRQPRPRPEQVLDEPGADHAGRARDEHARRSRHASLTPHLPRHVPALPEALEQPDVAQRVHRLPEAVVAERHQLADLGQPLERLALPDRIVPVDVVEHARLEDEEAAVDPALSICGFSVNSATRSPSKTSPPKRAGGRTAARRELAVRAVELDQLAAADVGDAVAVGEHERCRRGARLEPLDPTARLRRDAGVDEVDLPVLVAAVVDVDLPAADVDRKSFRRW